MNGSTHTHNNNNENYVIICCVVTNVYIWFVPLHPGFKKFVCKIKAELMFMAYRPNNQHLSISLFYWFRLRKAIDICVCKQQIGCIRSIFSIVKKVRHFNLHRRQCERVIGRKIWNCQCMLKSKQNSRIRSDLLCKENFSNSPENIKHIGNDEA